MKHVLETTWVPDDVKEKYDLRPIKGGFLLYSGVLLPKELRVHRSKDFGYARWVEDEMNAHVSSPDILPSITLNDVNTVSTVQKIVESYNDGLPGLYVESGLSFDAIPTMLTALSQVVQNLDNTKREKVLIVTHGPLVPQWRKFLKHFGGLLSSTRVLVLEYKYLDRLIETPAVARLVRSKATKTRAVSKNGQPTVDWDFVIFDNFQKTFGGHPSALTYQMAIVAKTTEQYSQGEKPFIMVHATDQSPSPMNFLPFPQLLVHASDSSDRIWGTEELGKKFSMVMTDKGWCWLGSPLPRGSKLIAPSEEVMSRAKNKYKRTYRTTLSKGCGTIIPESSGTSYRTVIIEPKGGLRARYADHWVNFRKNVNSGDDFDKNFDMFIKESNKVRQTGIVAWLESTLGPEIQCIIVTDDVIGARSFDEALEKNRLSDRVQSMSLSEVQEYSGRLSTTVVMMESVHTFDKFFMVSQKVKCSMVVIPCLEDSWEEVHAEKLFTADRVPCRTFVKRRAAQRLSPNRLS